MALLESIMEDRLIRQLCCDVSQWTLRNDIKDEDDLWANLREKLNRNNIAILDGELLTDSEMDQVKEFIRDQAETTYKAARWLAGEHRVAQIPVTREDASKGTIYLMAVNNREIAGGHSSYEVIHQLRSTGDTSGGSRDRRFDVTLLINGLPMIHIELKNTDHSLNDAFRQIVKYGEEGQFRGLMGLVQMYVVSNGSQTRYIAANNRGDLKEAFLTRWVNEENEPVEDCIAFAKAALNIPAAHLMVGKYSVLDNDQKKVILLRPYQIHAIEAIRKASRGSKNGFVWHTTGSGKTLTSYTVTKNLLDIPSVDKTIFLIDRKDLDTQTSSSFQSYADSDDIDVQETDTTKDLERKLANKDRTTIVTTIQKLQMIIRRCTADELTDAYKKLKEKIEKKRIAFVVDECHRAVTPETKRQLEKFFYRSLWYGFTGTPIFAENMRAQKGDLARTTQDLYGECLHKYTIKEAIGDRAVLGFHIQSLGHSNERFREIAVQMGLYEQEELKDVDADRLEREVVAEYKKKNKQDFYDNDNHRMSVIEYIVNKSAQKFGLNAPSGEAFEGLLTVQSIEDAQRYYKLICQFVADGRVKESVRQLVPDFPKVAITYTVGENEDGATADQKEMAQSLADYNAMFGTSWDLTTLAAYNTDLNDRLARKKSKYHVREEQLDLVIVVDRLLTGFDAPCMSTIFLDRPPMKPQHLIQAFSRTNRLFNKRKLFGQVVTMQMPACYEKGIDEALYLYSQGGTSDVAAPTWEETKEKCRKAADDLRRIIPSVKAAEQLQSKEELMAFAKAFQALDRAWSEAQVYDEYDKSRVADYLGMDPEEFEKLSGFYHNAIEKLRELSKKDTGDIPNLDIEYELESVKTIEVNYRYLVSLIQAHMPAQEEAVRPITEAESERITKYIASYAKQNPQIASLLMTVWMEVMANQEAFRGLDAYTVVQERIRALVEQEVTAFSQKWCVNAEELHAFAVSTPKSELDPKSVNTSMGDFKAWKEAGGSGSKLAYLRELRQAVYDFVHDKLKPLMEV